MNNTLNNELDNILEYEDELDENQVSFAEVLSVIEMKVSHSKNEILSSIKNMNLALSDGDHPVNQNIYNSYYDFYKKELYVDYQEDELFNQIIVNKKGGKIKVVQIDTYDYTNVIKNVVYDELKNMYDNYNNISELYKFADEREYIQSINSKFRVYFDEDMNFYQLDDDKSAKTNCLLIDLYRTILYNDFSIIFNFNNVKNEKTFSDKSLTEEEATQLMRNVYVNIDDCPECIKKELRLRRKNEIEEKKNNLNEDNNIFNKILIKVRNKFKK